MDTQTKPIIQIKLNRHVNYGNSFTEYIKRVADNVLKDQYNVIFTDKDVEITSSDSYVFVINFVNERKIETHLEVNKLALIDDIIDSLTNTIEKLEEFKTEIKEENNNDIPAE